IGSEPLFRFGYGPPPYRSLNKGSDPIYYFRPIALGRDRGHARRTFSGEMPMSLRLAISLALLTAAPAVLANPASAPTTLASSAQAGSAAAAPAPPKEQAWVTTSNIETTKLLKAQAVFQPEGASGAGLTEYDGLAVDLGPNINERYAAAMRIERARLVKRMAAE